MTRDHWPRIMVHGGTTATALAALFTACVTDHGSAVNCPPNLLCPPNWVCTEAAGKCHPETCGDGVHDEWNGELCDDKNAVDGDGCSGSCLFLDRCGDERMDPGETCDDGNMVSGDGCSEECIIEECLNSIIDVKDECDDGAETATCNLNCTLARCGDGYVNPLYINPLTGMREVCDEGTSTEYCDADCSLPECGDGYVNTLADEQCDDGNNSVNDACPSGAGKACHLAKCGDGFVHFGVEDCEPPQEDGLLVDGDKCDRDCTIAICGDGLVNEPSGEACDDGNRLNIDGCLDGMNGGCRLPACGDGFVYLGFELCDDGNEIITDACPSGAGRPCQPARCGDGFPLTDVEECDDGGDTSTCDADCTLALCGDGYLNPAIEQCETDIPCADPSLTCGLARSPITCLCSP